MAVWLIRAGKYGEFEQKFLQEGRAYLCWDGLNVDLKPLTDRDELFKVLQGTYETEKPQILTGQVSTELGADPFDRFWRSGLQDARPATWDDFEPLTKMASHE